ncbi:MAG: glycosyltransferase [Nibricoccus sp.]
MSARRTLVYFGHVPAEGAGSAIIVYRHLRRFAEAGWDVRVVADWGQTDEWCRKHGWPVLELSHRKKFWPPFNPDRPLSRAFRAWLWAGEARSWLGSTKPDAVFTYLSAFSDTLSLAAVGFARRYKLPLATIIHDDARDFVKSADEGTRAHARRQWIVENSTKAWFASPGLAACFTLDPKIVGVLPPIPEGVASAAATDPAPASAPGSQLSESTPLLVYAGNYWPPQLPVLAELSATIREAGGTLLAVLKENPEHVSFLRAHHVDWRAPFPKNTEALDYYRDHASAMVVSYARTSDDMPWTRTSFPSKLIEYCHLGLPLVIIAPEDTAIVQWARARNFPDVFAPSDSAGIARYTTQLRDPSFRRDRAALSLSFARGEFNPVTIQQQLVKSLSP